MAVILRLSYLGTNSLADYEAKWAMDAFNLSQGLSGEVGAHPLYILWTSLLFFVFGDNTFIARLIPALCGSALVLLAYLLRSIIGQKASLIFAFGLAIDPSLVAASRLIASPILSICFISFGLAAFLAQQKKKGVLFFTIALLTGEQFLHGGIGILIVMGVLWLFQRLGWIRFPQVEAAEIPQLTEQETVKPKRLVIISFYVGIFIIGATLFLRYPQGIGAFARSFSAYIEGWGSYSGVFPLQMLFMLVIYEPLIIMLGGMGFLRAWLQRDDLNRLLGVLAGVLLLWLMLYPQRQMVHLAWVAVPLWALASRELVVYLKYYDEDKKAALAHTALILLLLFLGWINLSGLTLPQPNEEVARTRWILLAGVLALGVLSTLLVGLGWSTQAAKFGLLVGVGIGLCLYMLSGMRPLVFPMPRGEGAPYPLGGVNLQWTPQPTTRLATLLVETLEDIAEWRNGNRQMIDIAVINPNMASAKPPSLMWTLRNFSKVEYLSQLDRTAEPTVVLMSILQPTPLLTSAYRGQSFALWVFPDWGQTSWMELLINHNILVRQEQMVLWVRSDLLTKTQIGKGLGQITFPKNAFASVPEWFVPK